VSVSLSHERPVKSMRVTEMFLKSVLVDDPYLAKKHAHVLRQSYKDKQYPDLHLEDDKKD
jgi:hypothetical protein